MGKIAGIEGRDVGYNWTLAPCVDINANPDTPTCTTRTAGTSAEQVLEFTSEYIRGCQEHGLMATAKHFPGDGFGIYDQHLTTAEIPQSFEQWQQTSDNSMFFGTSILNAFWEGLGMALGGQNP